jgi:hypothetical protein
MTEGANDEKPGARGTIGSLDLYNVGPAERMHFDFAPRLNLLTGDNGLGKSFVLDVLWWLLTETWAGDRAWPHRKVGPLDSWPTIRAVINHSDGAYDHAGGLYNSRTQAWNRDGRPPYLRPPLLALYVRVNGAIAMWDSLITRADGSPSPYPTPADPIFLDPASLWDGKYGEEEGRKHTACRGLIDDWVSWQRMAGPEFAALQAVLAALSEPEDPLQPGPPMRVRLGDRRDFPTLTTQVGTVAVTLASAGVRRILGLAYALVWAWTEHGRAAEQVGVERTNRLVLLVDEIELHLHPRWQRLMVPAVLRAVQVLAPEIAQIQVFATTHAPMVLASVEPLFDEATDELFHFDRTGQVISAEGIGFARQGNAANWLTSEVFGLSQARSAPAESAVLAAQAFMRGAHAEAEVALARTGKPTVGDDLAARIHVALVALLPDHDTFWPRWIVTYEKRNR